MTFTMDIGMVVTTDHGRFTNCVGTIIDFGGMSGEVFVRFQEGAFKTVAIMDVGMLRKA